MAVAARCEESSAGGHEPPASPGNANRMYPGPQVMPQRSGASPRGVLSHWRNNHLVLNPPGVGS